MNPELTTSLIAEHTRELTAQADAHRAAAVAVPRPRSGRRSPPATTSAGAGSAWR